MDSGILKRRYNNCTVKFVTVPVVVYLFLYVRVNFFLHYFSLALSLFKNARVFFYFFRPQTTHLFVFVYVVYIERIHDGDPSRFTLF